MSFGLPGNRRIARSVLQVQANGTAGNAYHQQARVPEPLQCGARRPRNGRGLWRAGGAGTERAKRLLERYAPPGPKGANPDQWGNWWQANKPYAFASDSSDYCWYIDPLAKKRSTPVTDLRGPRRADVPAKGD